MKRKFLISHFSLLNSGSGQSLFEVMFAVAITSLLVTGIVSLSAKAIRNSDYSKNNSIATKLASEGMEWLRSYRDGSWSDFAGKANSSGKRWCLNSLVPPTSSSCSNTITDTIYKREIVLTQEASDVVKAEVEVFWNDSNGLHTVDTVSYFTNWTL